MRTVAIAVHNYQSLEVFVEKRKRCFEVWVVGPIKRKRVVLDHHLTHDDIEAHLEYAMPGDLVWHDVERSEIPAEKHQNAIEMGNTIKERTFFDYDDSRLDEMEAQARQASGLPLWSGTHRSVTKHLDSIALLATDNEGMNEAKKALLGRWTDGLATLIIEPNHKLQWSCTDRQHPLNVGEQVHKHAPDWWNFGMWELGLMNDKYRCGTHVGVLRVDDRELHLNGSHPHRIAHVFHRDSATRYS